MLKNNNNVNKHNQNIIVSFALDLKFKFPLERGRRYDVKHIWIEIDKLTKEYINKE
jgi:hypothetical protein